VSLVPEAECLGGLRATVQATDPVALERAVGAEGRRAAKELYLAALRTLDERLVKDSGELGSVWNLDGWPRCSAGPGVALPGGA
jgi:hypothetical protein